MPSTGFAPFNDLGEETSALAATTWTLDGNEVSDGSGIPGWSYGMPLRFERTITIDPGAVRAETGLGEDATARVVAAWTAQSAISLGDRSVVIDIDLSGAVSVNHCIAVEVPSSRLAETVRLVTVLVLVRTGRNGSAGVAAHEPGSVLWRDSSRLTLEGVSARMPIVAVDFARLYPSDQSEAAWTLNTGPEWLRQHPSAALVVYLNANRPGLATALAAREPEPLQAAVQSTFLHDIGRALIDRALEDEDFQDDSEFPEESCGRSLQATLGAVFGGQTVDQIRRMREQDAGAFDRALQTRHRLLRELA